MKKLCALVAQTGARHNYALPAILAEAGCLNVFYTDLCAEIGFGRFAEKLSAFPLPLSVLEPIRRLLMRRLPVGVQEHTVTFDLAALQGVLQSAIRGYGTSSFKAFLLSETIQGKAMADRGLAGSNCVLSVFGYGGPLLYKAREQGVPVINDVIVALSTDHIVLEEQRLFPDWEAPWVKRTSPSGVSSGSKTLLDTSNVFLCPSDFVADDLVDNWGVDRDLVVVNPYPIAESWLKLPSKPIQGRVLFVGSCELRKGIHYLAAAGHILKERGVFDFRVAGGVAAELRSRNECGSLNFLGRVPRSTIGREYESADVFVLPTLAEGSATVVYEALAAGVPVVTTKSAGSVIKHGVEGLIVPERDPDALAEAVSCIVRNRKLRNQMSKAARITARKFVHANYAKKLVATCHSVL